MALQMSLDEIAIAKSRDLSKSKDENKTVLLSNNIPDSTILKTDIPVVLPK